MRKNVCVYSQVLGGSIGSMYTKVRHALENDDSSQ